MYIYIYVYMYILTYEYTQFDYNLENKRAFCTPGVKKEG